MTLTTKGVDRRALLEKYFSLDAFLVSTGLEKKWTAYDPFTYEPSHPLIDIALDQLWEDLPKSNRDLNAGFMIGALLVYDCIRKDWDIHFAHGGLKVPDALVKLLPKASFCKTPLSHGCEQRILNLKAEKNGLEAQLDLQSSDLAYHLRCRLLENEINKDEKALADIEEAYKHQRSLRRENRKETLSRPLSPDSLSVLADQWHTAGSLSKGNYKREKAIARDKLKLSRERKDAHLELEAGWKRRLEDINVRLLSRARADDVLAPGTEFEIRLSDLFEGKRIPDHAGECAATKLYASVLTEELIPLAFGQRWFGRSGKEEFRHSGSYYPPCRGACRPILHQIFNLKKLKIRESPSIVNFAYPHSEPKKVFEDTHCLVIEKPESMLSVPGIGSNATDSVLHRIRKRYPNLTGPIIVHRLDLETSGLMLLSKTAQAYAEFQKLFIHRRIEKKYVALLDQRPTAIGGEIGFRICADIRDRPRQIYHRYLGKASYTRWELIDPLNKHEVRVALYLQTGRTHQIRMHLAHPRGLGCPIKGDRLYGNMPRKVERLMLHAEKLSFTHPYSGEKMMFQAPCPF